MVTGGYPLEAKPTVIATAVGQLMAVKEMQLPAHEDPIDNGTMDLGRQAIPFFNCDEQTPDPGITPPLTEHVVGGDVRAV